MLNAIEIAVEQCNDAFSVPFLGQTLQLAETYEGLSIYILLNVTSFLFVYYILLISLSYHLQPSPSLVLHLQLPLFNLH